MKEDRKGKLIREYLEGSLEGTQLKEFEDELGHNPELAKEVKDYQRTERELRGMGADSFKMEMKKRDDEYKKGLSYKYNRKIHARNTYIAVAAVIILLMVSGIVLFMNFNDDLTDLYASYYTPYADMILGRGDQSEINPGLVVGMEAYNNGNYERAAEELTSYLQARENDFAAAMYLGISQMELNRFQDAENHLLLAQNDPSFRQQAQWYLALLYLKSDQSEKAISTLEDISADENHYRNVLAEEILEKIR